MLHSKPFTIVIDIGSYRTYAGIAGEENPRAAVHSYITEDTGLKTNNIYEKFSVGDN